MPPRTKPKPRLTSIPKGGEPVPGPTAFELDRLSDIVLLNDNQVAQLVGASTGTVKYWRQRGIGPRYVSINGRPRVSVRAVREWLGNLAEMTTPAA